MELIQITKVFSKGTQFRDHTGFTVIVKRFHYSKLGCGRKRAGGICSWVAIAKA
jgi:hypothetical protein